MVCMICIKHTVDSIHFSYGSLRPSPGMVYINILLLFLMWSTNLIDVVLL